MTTHIHRFAPDEHARIFGSTPDRTTGRSRLCKSCGDWHRLDRPWPHNCREPATARSDLASPMVAPAFKDFVAGAGIPDQEAYIGSRGDKREYMARNDFIEHEPGLARQETWVDKIKERRSIVQDIRKAMDTDPLNIPPLERIGESDLGGTADVDSTQVVETI